jgi:hypothetical protein
MNRQQFQSFEANMSRLQEILKDPVMQFALEVVKNEGHRDIPSPVPGVDYSALVATSGAETIGWAKAIRSLTSLPVKAIPQKATPQQSTMYRDRAKEKLLASKLYTEEEIDELLKNER